MEEMDENNDTWSLLAVVRECSMRVRNNAPTPAPAMTLPLPPTLTPGPAFEPISSSPFTMNGSALEPSSFGSFFPYNNTDYSFDHHDLVDFYKPFLVQPSPLGGTGANVPDPQLIGSLPKADTGCGPDSGGFLTLEPHQNPHQQHQLIPAPVVGATFQQHDDQQLLLRQRSLQNRKLQIPGACPVGIHKKKKFEERRVCKMRLEELSEDKWAWRKYGQKPIKGSPYPRNYYRCSTSKGCTARKQVERSPVEPNTYLVTYTGHHHHARPPLRTPARVTRPSDSTSSPEEESKSQTSTSASLTPTLAPYQNGSSSGSGSGSGEPVLGKNENENEEEEGDDDEEIELIPNSMADPELLMGMERLMNNDQKTSSGERKTDETVGNGYGYGYEYGYGYGYDMMMREIGAPDQNVNFGVVVRGNGLCLGIQQKELDSSSSGSAAPTTLAAAHESPDGRGRNIWDNGVINPQSFLF